MPGGNRTGPAGMGPMTGRAAGFCAGYPTPGYLNPAPGIWQGYGRYLQISRYAQPTANWPWVTSGWGRGFGLGWGRGFRLGRGRGFGFARGRGRRLW
ncbi:MAG: DUF5320 domain-containing protein [Deltaproteobacteria bacterium]|nr:DUF5320 domain-containing protein [Deltaproteobacteria bacterium]